jgi:hypothetical protein
VEVDLSTYVVGVGAVPETVVTGDQRWGRRLSSIGGLLHPRVLPVPIPPDPAATAPPCPPST